MSLRHALASLLCLLPAFAAPKAPSRRVHALLDRYWEEVLVRNPVAATAIGDRRYNGRFPDNLSEKARTGHRAWLERWLKRLEAVERKGLGEQDLLSLEVLAKELQVRLEGMVFPDHLIPLEQMESVPLLLAQLGSGEGIQPFGTVKDYRDFAKRARAMAAWMDQAQINLKEGMAKGLTQPRVLMERVVGQLDQLMVEDPAHSVFWGPFKARPKAIPSREWTRLQADYRVLIARDLMPAYRRLRDFLRKDYLPACRSTSGWSALPNGPAWYAHKVRLMTTTDLAPQAIHDRGLREVARILGEMETVRTQVGFKGDLPAFFRHLDSDPAYYAKAPEELLRGYRELQTRINGLVPKLFDVFPKADYVVKPVEAFRAQSAAGASYQAGTPDGKRPGVFYLNTFNLKAQPLFGMETLSLHEASPGHHFQISIAQEVQGLPKFRRFGDYNAFAEGWALYAESLGKELGLFTDPYQWYGRLSDEQLRAMRLVVDTGLHAKGWTREQAIAFMKANSSMAESDIVAEVERYMAWPGQALGYKLGQFVLRDLRSEAERELGSRFDVKAFHRQVLVDGSLPLDVLQAKVRKWIRGLKKGKTRVKTTDSADDAD